MPIWVNEQFDQCGILRACIATIDEEQARDCHRSFMDNLTDDQVAEGWTAKMRKVETWDDVPVNALKLD